MSPRGTRARRARKAQRTIWLVAGAVVVGATGVTAVAATGDSGDTGSMGNSNSRPAKAHTLALDGKDQKKRTLPRTETQTFSLVGVSWDDSTDAFGGTAQIRTRGADDGTWTDWSDLDFGIRAPESAEGKDSEVRGASEPLWVGPSDAIEARVLADGEETAVPKALRLDMIDPGVTVKGQGKGNGKGDGKPSARPKKSDASAPSPSASEDGTAPSTTPEPTASQPSEPSGPTDAPATEPPSSPTAPATSEAPQVPSAEPSTSAPGEDPTTEPTAPTTQPDPTDPTTPATEEPQEPTAEPSATAPSEDPTAEPSSTPDPQPTASTSTEPDPTGSTGPVTPPAPQIVSRAAWGADETLVTDPPSYLAKVDAVFVHHTAGTNSYECAESPAIIRAILTYHVKTNGWSDLGYNFFVDKCGTVFEGRAGGTDKPVRGAHTYGFNGYSSGVSLLGDYENGGTPTAEAKQAIADVSAWKLGLHGVDPEAQVTLTAAGDTGVWKTGDRATLNTISGHRDGFATLCPGATLYSALPEIRSAAGASVYAAS